MSDKVLLTVKTDKKLKEEAQRVAREMGVPLSAIINAQLQRVVDERMITLHAPVPKHSTLGRRAAKLARDTNPSNWSKPLQTKDGVKAYLASLK